MTEANVEREMNRAQKLSDYKQAAFAFPVNRRIEQCLGLEHYCHCYKVWYGSITKHNELVLVESMKESFLCSILSLYTFYPIVLFLFSFLQLEFNTVLHFKR